jgi:hypothetical protein
LIACLREIDSPHQERSFKMLMSLEQRSAKSRNTLQVDTQVDEIENEENVASAMSLININEKASC